MNLKICYDVEHPPYLILEERLPGQPANFHVYEAPPPYPSLEPSPQGCTYRATAATFEDAYARVEEFAHENARANRAAWAREQELRRQRLGARAD